MNFSEFTYKEMSQNLKLFIDCEKTHHNILEIGCGEGISTNFFINYFDNMLTNFSYTGYEILEKYKDRLNSIKKCEVIIDSFENINNQKFDIIILTVFSALNDKNINKIFDLCNEDTLILTIFRNREKVSKYFDISHYQNLRIFQDIFVLKIKNPNKKLN